MFYSTDNLTRSGLTHRATADLAKAWQKSLKGALRHGIVLTLFPPVQATPVLTYLPDTALISIAIYLPVSALFLRRMVYTCCATMHDLRLGCQAVSSILLSTLFKFNIPPQNFCPKLWCTTLTKSCYNIFRSLLSLVMPPPCILLLIKRAFICHIYM